MKFSSKSLFILSTLGIAVLSGCQNQPNSITFTTPSPTISFNPQNQSAMVNVMAQDLRPSAEVASYTLAGNTQRLSAVPDVRMLFQQAMQQNLNSKGFSVVPGAGNANVLVNVRKFYADVEQGNVRYKVNANIHLEVLVQGSRGNFTKNFTTSRSYEGAFNAQHSKIQEVLNQAYTEIIHSMYNDNELTQAIHQYK